MYVSSPTFLTDVCYLTNARPAFVQHQSYTIRLLVCYVEFLFDAKNVIVVDQKIASFHLDFTYNNSIRTIVFNAQST